MQKPSIIIYVEPMSHKRKKPQIQIWKLKITANDEIYLAIRTSEFDIL